MSPSDARHAPATARNREPIRAVLEDVLPAAGLVLEIAAGTGEHAVNFAAAFPQLTWQPSDPDPAAWRSIAAHAAQVNLPNLRPPLKVDVSLPDWHRALAEKPAAILAVNMVHISPWEATLGLLHGAGETLPPGGPLILYGPYHRKGHATAPSNEAFDESLRSRDPRWGLRLLEEVTQQAEAESLALERVVEMPANNLTVVYRRR